MEAIERLLQIMGRLRDPQTGCPWDREQTFATLVPFTLEEAYEVADAVAQGSPEALRDELGDLLFQVVFYAQLAKEAGRFEFSDVAAAISDKLVRRHPHVFADAQVGTAEEQHLAWEHHKAAERATAGGRPSALDGVARALPALVRAEKLQRRAAAVGFDWPDLEGVLSKVAEELEEVHAELDARDPGRLHHELGDLLFACVNLARHLGVDAEAAVRSANERFEHRFRHVEEGLAGRRDAPLEEMEALWEAAKAAEKA